MRAVAVFAVVSLLLAACGGEAPITKTDLLVRVELGAGVVAPGEATSLVVTRVWSKDLDPSPWEDAVLAPLVVRHEETRRREDDERVEEVRRFRAYVFGLDDVVLPRIPFAGRPKDGGEVRVVASRPLAIRVQPSLDPRDPGRPELPAPLPARKPPWIPIAAVFVVLLAGLVAVRARSRGEPAPEETPEVRDDSALARLRALRAQHERFSVERAAAVVEAVACVRDHIATHEDIDARALTTEELVVALRDADVLGPCLHLGDDVKFARHEPTDGEYLGALDAAIDYVASRTEVSEEVGS